MAGKPFLVSVRLKGYKGKTVSESLYPIAVTGPGGGDTYAGIFDGMGSMPAVPLSLAPAVPEAVLNGSAPGSFDLTVSNPTDRLAFFVRIRLLEESETLKTMYSDNYFSLLPGETTTVTVTLRTTMPESLPSRVRFEISGWNVPAQTCDVSVKKD